MRSSCTVQQYSTDIDLQGNANGTYSSSAKELFFCDEEGLATVIIILPLLLLVVLTTPRDGIRMCSGRSSSHGSSLLNVFRTTTFGIMHVQQHGGAVTTTIAAVTALTAIIVIILLLIFVVLAITVTVVVATGVGQTHSRVLVCEHFQSQACRGGRKGLEPHHARLVDQVGRFLRPLVRVGSRLRRNDGGKASPSLPKRRRRGC